MLKKINRLTKQKDFEKVFNTGKSAYSKLLGIKTTANNLEFSRFGIMISAQVSKKAVERNKIKRQIRAILTLQFNQLKSGFDIVIITLPEILGKTYNEIEAQIVNLLKKLKLYKSNK